MAIAFMSQLTQITWNCFIGCFYVYSLWHYSQVIVASTFPFAILCSFGLFLLIHFLRVPPPDDITVQNLIGVDPWSNDELTTTNYFMKTCAHRFAGLDAPENSISAIQKSKEKGCTCVEFDVTLTKDGVAILFHDADVNRLCDATGTIKNMTWNELEALDISVKHPLGERFSGEKIALFDEAIKLCLEYEYRMFIDLKGDDMRIVPVILDAFKKNEKLYSIALVSSFNPVLIYMIRKSNPRIGGSLAWRPHYLAYQNYSGVLGPEGRTYSNPLFHYTALIMDIVYEWLLNNVIYYLLGISTILLHKDIITSSLAMSWRKRGVRPIAYTVNLPVAKQYYRRVLQVSYMTDTIDSEGY